MVPKIAEHPFLFTGCWELWEMVWRSARDEQQLLEASKKSPLTPSSKRNTTIVVTDR
jgi:hypothetical protein